jgi:hypothetical protein
MILNQLAVGLLAIVVSVLIHASFMVTAFRPFSRLALGVQTYLGKGLLISALVLWFFLSITVQCWAWAGLLLWLGALSSLEEALYFATVTFTSLGYGDIVLEPRWRLLGAFAATNGMIIIGWTAALIFLAVQSVYGLRKRG